MQWQNRKFLNYFVVRKEYGKVPTYEKFKMIIDEKNIKPSTVAKATGLSSTVFSDWKSGKSKPKVDKLVKIANYLGVQIGYFIDTE